MHTPGPWEFEIDTALILSSESVIADVDDTPNWRNNARLIAAAPDLLEALKLAATAMEINDPHYFDESETAGKIRAAIAKAEGK